MSDSIDDLRSQVLALAGRVRELEDERTIRELLSEYGYCSDAGDDVEYVNLYTEDGVLDVTMGPSHFEFAGVSRWAGHEALAEFIANPNAHHIVGFYQHSLHVQGNNVTIEIDGDEATAIGYSIVLQQTPTGISMVAAGVNRWRFRRHESGWRISERVRREPGHPDALRILSASARRSSGV